MRRHVDDRAGGDAADRRARWERGIGFVDAPVTGSSPKAEDGTLTIMAGGDEADFERRGRCSRSWASSSCTSGELGQGQTVKLINNAVAAANAARSPRRSWSARRRGSTSRRS